MRSPSLQTGGAAATKRAIKTKAMPLPCRSLEGALVSAQGQTPFAFFDHDGEAYHLRLVEGGVDILREIDGEDCYIAQVDTVTEARAFISVYAGQLI